MRGSWGVTLPMVLTHLSPPLFSTAIYLISCFSPDSKANVCCDEDEEPALEPVLVGQGHDNEPGSQHHRCVDHDVEDGHNEDPFSNKQGFGSSLI